MQICVRCGKTNEVVSFSTMERKDGTLYYYKQCTECVWKRDKRRKKAIKEGNILKGRPGAVKRPRKGSVWVLWTPNNEYPRGNYFNNSEFMDTLKAGVWTLGMLVKIQEQKYAVCGNGVVMRTMKQLGYPLGVSLPEQSLIEVNGRARL